MQTKMNRIENIEIAFCLAENEASIRNSICSETSFYPPSSSYTTEQSSKETDSSFSSVVHSGSKTDSQHAKEQTNMNQIENIEIAFCLEENEASIQRSICSETSFYPSSSSYSTYQTSNETDSSFSPTVRRSSETDYSIASIVTAVEFENNTIDEPSIREECKLLGKDFKPGNWDVICGSRGKHIYDHVGNRRLRVLVARNLRNYVQATSQYEKSLLTISIIELVRNAAKANGCEGGFVERKPNGQWLEIGTLRARDKVGHMFRDYMKGPLLRRLNDKSTNIEKENQIQQAEDAIFKSCRILCNKKSNNKSSIRKRRSTSEIETEQQKMKKINMRIQHQVLQAVAGNSSHCMSQGDDCDDATTRSVITV